MKFLNAFSCKRPKSKIKIPEFELEDVEDYYTLYVLIFGISEEMFWNADIPFIRSVVENKIAFDNYIAYQNEKLLEQNR